MMTFMIRRANAEDAQAIKALVRSAGNNPMGIHWQRFLVAEDSGRIIGIGQIKVHGDGSRELASIATVTDRRGEGVATAIIQELLRMDASEGSGTLYLTCRAHMRPFYQPFGFRRVSRFSEMAPYFRRLMRAGAVLFAVARFFGYTDEGTVMVRKED